MNKIQKNIIAKISKEALILDWKKAFAGKAYGNRHLFRVAKIVKFLVKNEGGDLFIAQLGGWIHDVSLAWGSDYDPKLVEIRTRRFLKKFHTLNNNELNRIAECATLHEKSGKSSNIEAKIVHDADVIDKSGTLGIIRHIWKMTNMLENRILTKESDLKKLKEHLKSREISIYTKTGKRLVDSLNEQIPSFFAEENLSLNLMQMVSEKASRGFTSDKIARMLIKRSTSKIYKNLKSQLNCSYLK